MKDIHRPATGWPQPLNRGGGLKQVKNTAFVGAINRGPSYTGSTVALRSRVRYFMTKSIDAKREIVFQ